MWPPKTMYTSHSLTFQFLQASTDSFPRCANDGSSFANCEAIVTNHFQLDVYANFTNSSLIGTNTITLTAVQDGVAEIVLDYQGLVIWKAEVMGGDTKYKEVNCEYHTDPNVGSAVRLLLTDSKDYIY